MLNKFYEKSKKYIKENYKTLLFFLVLYVFFLFPVDYYIIIGGGIMKVGNRILVDDEYPSKGSFNLAYVSEIKGTIATYVLSYLNSDFKRVSASDYTYDSTEKMKEVDFRGDIDLLVASQNAIKNAYLLAGKEYQVTSTDFYVYYVDKDHKSEYQVGDKILEVDHQAITSLEQYREIISQKKEGDRIHLLVERGGRKKEFDVSLYEEEGKVLSGIYVSAVDQYETDPKVKIQFKKSESGPSGGLVEALDIYNKLVKKDITKGLTIAGTGEIDSSGNIGEIGGVKYKLLGAEKKKADLFLVPKGENYNTCMKVKKEKKLKIKVIGVSTLQEAIEELEKYQP